MSHNFAFYTIWYALSIASFIFCIDLQKISVSENLFRTFQQYKSSDIPITKFGIYSKKSGTSPLFNYYPLFCIRLLDLRNRRLLHRNPTVFVAAKLNDDGIFRNIDYDTVETACCEHAVTHAHIR